MVIDRYISCMVYRYRWYIQLYIRYILRLLVFKGIYALEVLLTGWRYKEKKHTIFKGTLIHVKPRNTELNCIFHSYCYFLECKPYMYGNAHL